MIDLTVLGPSRPSTFRRVFSGVPGAIYGCLKVRALLREEKWVLASMVSVGRLGV